LAVVTGWGRDGADGDGWPASASRPRRPAEVTRDHDADLAALVAELSSDQAALTRSRAHWLSRQAAAEGTFGGILRDLAERGRPVLLSLHNGRLHRGVTTVVGADFVVVRMGPGRDVAIALAALSSVRTLPGEPATTGDRFVPATTSLAEMLSALGEERTRVLIVLRAVGRDVLTVRLGGDGGTAYVALGSVAEISLVESG
jgi:hypothetical protein